MDRRLKEIINKNSELRERVEREAWSVNYNKKADMIIMGGDFPVNTSYYPVGDTGVMIRIDKDEKIYGFAIENVKFFMKKNPSLNNIKNIFAISDYVAGKAVYC
ncbi:MAG: hypothetical protein WCP15_02100 [bacterium]